MSTQAAPAAPAPGAQVPAAAAKSSGCPAGAVRTPGAPLRKDGLRGISTKVKDALYAWMAAPSKGAPEYEDGRAVLEQVFSNAEVEAGTLRMTCTAVAAHLILAGAPPRKLPTAAFAFTDRSGGSAVVLAVRGDQATHARDVFLKPKKDATKALLGMLHTTDTPSAACLHPYFTYCVHNFLQWHASAEVFDPSLAAPTFERCGAPVAAIVEAAERDRLYVCVLVPTSSSRLSNLTIKRPIDKRNPADLTEAAEHVATWKENEAKRIARDAEQGRLADGHYLRTVEVIHDMFRTPEERAQRYETERASLTEASCSSGDAQGGAAADGLETVTLPTAQEGVVEDEDSDPEAGPIRTHAKQGKQARPITRAPSPTGSDKKVRKEKAMSMKEWLVNDLPKGKKTASKAKVSEKALSFIDSGARQGSASEDKREAEETKKFKGAHDISESDDESVVDAKKKKKKRDSEKKRRRRVQQSESEEDEFSDSGSDDDEEEEEEEDSGEEMESDRSESDDPSRMSDDLTGEDEEGEDEETSSSEVDEEDRGEKSKGAPVGGRGRVASPNAGKRRSGDGMRQMTLLSPMKGAAAADDSDGGDGGGGGRRALAAGGAKAAATAGDSRKPARDMRRSIAAEAVAMLDCASVGVPTAHAPAIVEMVAKVRADFDKYSDDQFSVKDNYALIQNLIALCRLKDTIRSVEMTEDERREDGQLACQLAVCTAATACELAPVVETLRDHQAAHIATLNTLLSKLKGVSESMAGAVVVRKRPREEEAPPTEA